MTRSRPARVSVEYLAEGVLEATLPAPALRLLLQPLEGLGGEGLASVKSCLDVMAISGAGARA